LALQGNLEGACVAGWFSSAVYICCLADETSNGLKLRNDKCRPLMLGLLPRSIADKVYHSGSPRIDTSGLASAPRVLSRAEAVSPISCP